MEQVRWERVELPQTAGGRLLTPGVAAIACLHILGFAVPLFMPEQSAVSLVLALGLGADGLFHRLRLWQPLTYAGLYPTPCLVGLLISFLFILLFCGSRLERAWGTARFLLFCVLTSAAAGLIRVLPETESGMVLVGSTGLLCAVLAAFGHVCRGEKMYWTCSSESFPRSEILTNGAEKVFP